MPDNSNNAGEYYGPVRPAKQRGRKPTVRPRANTAGIVMVSMKPSAIRMRLQREGASKDQIYRILGPNYINCKNLPERITKLEWDNYKTRALIDHANSLAAEIAPPTPQQDYAARRIQAEAEEAYRQVLRAAALKSLWVLLTEVIFHPSVTCTQDTTPPGDGVEGCCYKKSVFYEPLHRPWCEFVQDLTAPNRGILAPRGHFKSSCTSLGFAAWLILNRPNIRILVISAVEGNAIRFAGVVKDAFHRNARMRWLFPERCPPPDARFGTEQEFTVPGRTDITATAPTLFSAHLEAALSSQHVDVVLFDDPITEKNVTTEEQAAKAVTHFNKAIPLLDPGGITRILATRYAHFDLYSLLVPEAQGGVATSTPYEWIVRAALETDGRPDFENGDPIFPTRFPRSVLMDLLAKARLDPTQGETYWWNQYMNICRAPGTEPFLESWFVEIPPENVPPLFQRMIVIDTALKDDVRGKGGDYTVIWAGGWDREGKLYVFADAYRSNTLRTVEFCNILTATAQRYQIVTVVKQRVSEDTLGTTIRNAFAAVPLPVNYVPIVIAGMGRKVQRIKDALQGPMQMQEVFFVQRRLKDGSLASNPVLPALKKELMHLGQYSSDDAADALANFFHPDVRIRKQNLVSRSEWRVPHAPADLAVRIDERNQKGWTSLRDRLGRGAGWASN